MHPVQDDLDTLHDAAYDAMARGELAEASRLFARLLLHKPENQYYHYMLGLAHKYLRDWPASLQHNLRAIALASKPGDAELWNAAIAATALADWPRARRLWQDCGIQVPEGEGPIDADYGVAVVRLNPWSGGETVFMRRIDPVRARLLNVPLPESGHRFGDVVLHDGAVTGHRHDGQREVPVFNELQRIERSEFQTFVGFVDCGSRDDLLALQQASAPGVAYLEDWTHSVRHYCIRCSYGTPHRHENDGHAGDWRTQRNLGIAAHDRESVEKLLQAWVDGGRGRRIDAIETRECDIPAAEDGQAWWNAEPPER
ncbi:hypothetical protein FKV24_006280 [Lysobacter maris]|uniref:Tetratricopeptide repeat protein n=1 Tax=Marilutibacter maris TaxID=1605891 RepID=A0A508AVZ1_9GAMM|nr:hypothetical protein [Lysobacter maris]KAB8193939.1 hypothetical protein FKV24_006280 [Lysobacter maris]